MFKFSNKYIFINTEAKFKNFLYKYKKKYKNSKKFEETANLFFYDMGINCFFDITNNNLKFYLFLNKNLIKKNVQYAIDNNILNYNKLSKLLKKFEKIVKKKYWGQENLKNKLTNIYIANSIIYILNYKSNNNIMNNYDKIYYDMISQFNKKYKIKNMSYFLHIFDHPIKYKYKYKNFIDIETNTKKKIKSNLEPILNGTYSDLYKHKPIPYIDGWVYANSDKKTIKKIINPYYNLKKRIITDWNKKKNIFFFRGTVNGKYFNDIKKNDRLRFAKYLDNLKLKNHKLYKLFDFSLYDNRNDIKIEDNKIVFYQHNKVIKKFKNPSELFNREKNYNNYEFKYIINIDGEVNAWRLAAELSYNSVILIVESRYNYKSWFYNKLKPYIHYIPIKNDISNLPHEMNKLLKDDNYAKKIANNATKFYHKHLTKDKILEYLHKNL